MELHKDQIPGDTIWALVTEFGPGTIDVECYLTAEASSHDYRQTVIYMKTHSGGKCVRFKVSLPRRRMEIQEARPYVMDKLVDALDRGPGLAADPDGTWQLLDIFYRDFAE
jgi:hypothetical protein